MPKIDATGAGHFDTVSDGGGGEPDGGYGQQPDDQSQDGDKKKKGASPPSQKDSLERTRRPTHSAITARPSGLPTGAGAEPNMDAQIPDMRVRLAALENTFQYIGTGHPDFAKMKVEVDQLRAMLGAYDNSD